MNLNNCSFTFREDQEPDGYVIYADDNYSYVLCGSCVDAAKEREFPVYSDQLPTEVIQCDLCGRYISKVLWPWGKKGSSNEQP